MDEGQYYDPEKKRSPLLKIVIIVLAVLAVILFIVFLSKAFGKGPDLYNEITNLSKTYTDNKKDYPEEIGECNTYTLNVLLDSNYLTNKKIFSGCDGTKTYVKVCKISDDKYQYTPVLSCKRNTTVFGEWKTGTIVDIIENNSEVEIYYDGDVLEKGSRTYYPNNLTDVSKVAEYYVASPESGYSYKVNPQTAYKWYVSGYDKEYYNNGEYVSTKPDGYPEKENGKTNDYLMPTRPVDAYYRTIKNVTIYATEKVAYPFKYECSDPKLAGTMYSQTLCELRKTGTFEKTARILYTCDGKTEVSEGTICQSRSKWTTTSCESKNQTKVGKTNEGYDSLTAPLTGYTCVKTNGYSVSDQVYQWYKMVDVKKYYPSNSTNVDDEKTYYISTPTAGASKDEKTRTTAYQYFKLEASDSAVPAWISIGDVGMNEKELINKFNELGYNVGSLSDIENNENTRYQIVIKYRNRK